MSTNASRRACSVACALSLALASWAGTVAAEQTATPLAPADGPRPVRVSTLEAIAFHPEHVAPATVVSNSETTLSAELAARVVAFEPRVGDVVPAGEVIARLDCRDFEFALAAARAEVEALEARVQLAKQRYARAATLSESQTLACEALDQRTADLAALVAEVGGARARAEAGAVQVGRCVIRSPFRALLRERLAPLGDFTAVGDPVARVVDVDDLELSAAVPAAGVADLARSDELVFIHAGQRYPLRLRAALIALDPETRNREVRLDFTGERPLVGSAGDLAWRDPLPHVPGQVLVRRDDTLGLFVVEEGRARFLAVAGAQAGRATAVDLPADTLIVTEGQFALSDGQAVAAATE